MNNRNDTIGFGIKLASLPEVSTNALKATVGMTDLILDTPWADHVFIPENEVRQATGMTVDIVKSALPELGIVERGAPGRRMTAMQVGKASEWALNLDMPRNWVPWPTYTLSPSNPFWDRKSNSIGPQGWRAAMALLDVFGFDGGGQFTNSDLRNWTGMTSKTANRTIDRVDGSFITSHLGRRNVYVFHPEVLEKQNIPFVRPALPSDQERAEDRDRMKTQLGSIDLADATSGPVPTIRDQRPDENPDAYQARRTKLEALFATLALKEEARTRALIK